MKYGDDTHSDLPNNAPRPEGEEQQLLAIWATPRGWRAPTVINNTVVGLLYMGAAFTFFVLAGILALVMRSQLAWAENSLVDQELYNQLFTVHGTTMMFLFAVPAVEALGVRLLPQMLGSRDLPFPRLSAFAVWTYIIGGSVFFLTIFVDLAPKGGWFMYPPLTLTEFSPGNNEDFWLLGIGFIEISAIAGAIEIIIGILRTRPPGMTFDKLPVFAWAMLIFAGMIVIAFPAVILATLFLEIERSFGWPFFTAAHGGDPLLWQHLFWFFGHPEVYIIFLPAAGLVSMIIPAMARTRLVGYRMIVVALIATGFFSFGLWVHHMFTTGIPALSLAFFSAASMAVAIPSGIQVFSWIATMAKAPRKFRITTPSLFILGMLGIFTIGGLTGVMVAMVPFDQQAHDSYFIVAHLHYVLVGGMVFPMFAVYYYWAPIFSKRRLSERLGKWTFWLMFVGFNTTFFPMHIVGLLGMPRRVWTYSADMGWDGYNLVSTIGAYMLACGIAVFIVDLVRHLRVGEKCATNPWDAGTLEWLSGKVYSMRSIPRVNSLEPLWDQPELAKQVQAGQHYLPNAPTGGREIIVTSAMQAEPQYVLQLPQPSWAHIWAAVFTGGSFLLLTVKLVVPAICSAIIAVLCMLWWTWDLDKGPAKGPVDIGGGISLPVYMTGPQSHSWWAMVVLMLVGGSLYLAYMFSYLYLWTVAPQVWPTTASDIAQLHWPLLAGLCLIGCAGSFYITQRTLAKSGRPGWLIPAGIVTGATLGCAAIGFELYGHLASGLNPTDHSYGALVYMATILSGQLMVIIVIMSLFAIARGVTGKLDAARSVSLENTALLVYYTTAQALLGLLLIHLFPRLVSL